MSQTRRLRIGFVSIEDATSQVSWSGIPYNILSHLKKFPIEIETVTPLERGMKYWSLPALAVTRASNRRLVMDHSSLLLKSYANQIERKLVGKNIDVVLSLTCKPITYLNTQAPIVFWSDAVFHDLIGYYPGFFSQLTSRAISGGKRKEERGIRRAEVAVYSSNWAANRAKQITDPQRVHVVPFGSGLSNEETGESFQTRVASKIRLRGNSCRLLFVGVDWIRKGGEVAVETARLLNEIGLNATLDVVGGQPQSTLPPFVRCHGQISKETHNGRKLIAELFLASDIFILPTRADASPIVFAEACAFGVPILSYNTGGTPEYVLQDFNGLTLPPTASAGDFALSTQRILRHDIYPVMAENAFSLYRDKFNWQKAIAGVVQLCESLA